MVVSAGFDSIVSACVFNIDNMCVTLSDTISPLELIETVA